MVAKKRRRKTTSPPAERRRKAAAANVAHISKDLRLLARQMSRLRPDPDNVRLHDERNIETIRASLAEHGQQKPIVLQPDGKTVAAGSGTLLAARLLGWKWIAAIRYDRDPGAVAAYAVTDNRSAELATWDAAALLRLFKHYDDMENGRDLVPGWTEAEIQLLLPGMKETTEDEAPGPPAAPVSVSGEIYELGPHRLLCGDSMAPEAVSALCLASSAPDPEVFWTDPPYGVAYTGRTQKALTMDNDAGKGLREFLSSAFRAADAILAPGARFYVAAPPGPHNLIFRLALQDVGWRFHQGLVWVKHLMVLGHSDYHMRHEDLLYGWKPGSGRLGRGRHKGSRWYGGHDKNTVFEIDRPSRSEEHPTMKPVELVVRCLRNSSKRGDVVYDPFVGSGTTIIAAEQTERICYAVEIDPGYCDVTRQRYANFVGDPAYSPTGKLDKPSADGAG